MYDQMEFRLNWEELEYRDKITKQPLPETQKIDEEENMPEAEYFHNKIEYRGISFLPVIISDKEKLCYFSENEDRYQLIPKIKSTSGSDSEGSD